MSLLLALAAAAALSSPAPPALTATRAVAPNPTPGLINAGRFDDRAMVRPVDVAPCATGNFTKWPEAGCLRRTEHAPARR